jgi:hypothetical protein
MAKKHDPRELLEDVLALIAGDVAEIEKLSGSGKFDSEVSSCLVKYSDALLKIVKDTDGQKEAERNKLANMSPQELKERAQHYLDKMKK